VQLEGADGEESEAESHSGDSVEDELLFGIQASAWQDLHDAFGGCIPSQIIAAVQNGSAMSDIIDRLRVRPCMDLEHVREMPPASVARGYGAPPPLHQHSRQGGPSGAK
jgi:hypothetical protein